MGEGEEEDDDDDEVEDKNESERLPCIFFNNSSILTVALALFVDVGEVLLDGLIEVNKLS